MGRSSKPKKQPAKATAYDAAPYSLETYYAYGDDPAIVTKELLKRAGDIRQATQVILEVQWQETKDGAPYTGILVVVL